MTNGPVRIQLAIQGGGAKICALVAALETVQLLEREDLIRVTRVAGTSAGAIAGCLFAAGIDMKVVKERLKALTADQLERMFPRPSWTRLLWRLVIRQQPLWATGPLEEILNSLFKEVGSPKTLEEIVAKSTVDVRIVAADLTNGRKIVHHGPVPLMSSLLDSAGLPYCFRSWTRSGNSVIVDGGICENLPSEELEQFSKDDGPVVGICFTGPRRASVDDIIDFSKALLDTAMANSEDRARLRLGESALRIEVDIGTFDFERALREGLGDKYDLVKQKAEKFFRDFVDSKRKTKQVVVGDPWATENRDMLERLGRVYDAQFRHTKCAYLRCSMVVEARSLFGRGEPDLIHNSWEFRTLNDPVYCRAVGVSYALDETFFEGTTFVAFDLTKNRVINIIHLPAFFPTLPTPRPLLLFFDPFLPPQSGPYKLDFKDLVDDALKSLREKKSDEMLFNVPNAEGKIGRVDLVLYLPKDYNEVKMAPKGGLPVGRPMSGDELAAYPPPPKFRVQGWTHSDLDKPYLGVVDLLSD